MKNISLLFFALLLLVGVGCTKPPVASEPEAQPPPQDTPTVSEEEQAFLDSGRAKAIEDEIDLWRYEEVTAAGFSLRVPHDIEFAVNPQDLGTANDYRLVITVQPVDQNLTGTMGYDQESAVANRIALASGEYGNDVDFPLTESKRVRSLGFANAQEFMVLGRFEICDVTYERHLYFFSNNQLVTLTLYPADNDRFTALLSDYFTTNVTNCGDSSVWDFDRQDDFYAMLEAGDGPELVQRWFNLFDQIIDTIALMQVAGWENELQGIWRATDDEKTTVEFRNGQKLDYYDGQLVSEETYESNGQALTVTADDETFEYSVDLLGDNLTLTYLPRGNRLTFIRE